LTFDNLSMKKEIFVLGFLFILISCGRTTVYPSDKKTKYIFTNQTNQGANLIGLKENILVKTIFVKDSSSSEFEVTTAKTFSFAESFFNDADSVVIRFENGKTTTFDLKDINFFHKSPLSADAYSHSRINEEYLQKTYFITQELLDSAK